MAHFPKFGARRLKLLAERFPDAEAAFRAKLPELVRAGIKQAVAAEFIAARAQIDPAGILAELKRENIRVVAQEDGQYPGLLKEIYVPPYLLFVRGDLSALDDFAVAVVGTRKFSQYGRRVTEKISRELAENRIAVVSGLALGTDALAHRACLEAGGYTVAVLGTGLDRSGIYPSANRYLAEQIAAKGGAVISEFPLRTRPWRSNFPQRNRIIAGLSLGTVVTEAGERSGALITARCALEQNREVYAVPGSIYSPVSAGPNGLIRQGAKPVSGAADILEDLNLEQAAEYAENKRVMPETREESAILEKLEHEPRHIDELTRATGLPPATVTATLTIMEMKGLVKNLGNMEYVLAR